MPSVNLISTPAPNSLLAPCSFPKDGFILRSLEAILAVVWPGTRLRSPRSLVEGDKGRKVAEKLRGLEGAWRTQKAREAWLETDDVSSCAAGEEWDASLGTLGAGNHFAEIQVVESSSHNLNLTSNSHYKLYEGEVVLVVHSGSRGYGSYTLKHFTKDRGCDSIREDDPVAKEYLKAQDRACAWASRNRDLIALRLLACLEPGDDSWDLGINSNDTTSVELIRKARRSVRSRKVVDVYHNNVERTTWPPAPQINDLTTSDLTTTIASVHLSPQSPTETYYIHRKGAAPTHSPTTHTPLPILPLPGSCATPTLILHPTFSPLNTHGQINALSLAHGAGRALSRAKALTYVSEKYGGKAEDWLHGDFVAIDRKGNKIRESGDKGGRDMDGGCWVVCEEKVLVWEEAPEAYKDVWDVGGDLMGRGWAEVVGWCRGRVSYKVRKG